MVPVVVFSTEKIAEQIRETIEEFFSVSVVSEKEINIFSDSEVLFIDHRSKYSVITDGILLISDECLADECEASVIVADSSVGMSVYPKERQNFQYITCGMNSKDTVSFSSIESGKVTVSLMRAIKDINGNIVEPFEVSVTSKTNISAYSPFCLFCIVVLIILLGKTVNEQRIVLK